jgi:hypothetical protein
VGKNQEVFSADEAIAELILATSYTIDHFYRFSIFNGGLSKHQFIFLFNCYQQRENRNNEFVAALQGVDLRKATGKTTARTSGNSPDNPVPLFGDPEDYADLPMTEREEMTNNMLSKHKVWAGDSINKKAKV